MILFLVEVPIAAYIAMAADEGEWVKLTAFRGKFFSLIDFTVAAVFGDLGRG